MFYCELRGHPRRLGKVKLVPTSELDNHTGFRSVYCFDESAARLIVGMNGTSNLQDSPLYSDTLFMDFDDAPEAAEQFHQYLIELGVGYTRWDSGGRSIHFHVNLVPKQYRGIYKDQRTWVKTHAPLADITFYNPAGMFRLPNTWHAKHAGKQKVLLNTGIGKPLDIPRVEQVISIFKPHLVDTEVSKDFDMSTLLQYMRTDVPPGGRYHHLLIIEKLSSQLGLDPYDTAKTWNKNLTCPHEDEYINRRITELLHTRERKMV